MGEGRKQVHVCSYLKRETLEGNKAFIKSSFLPGEGDRRTGREGGISFSINLRFSIHMTVLPIPYMELNKKECSVVDSRIVVSRKRMC